jgi:hypothetical protein
MNTDKLIAAAPEMYEALRQLRALRDGMPSAEQSKKAWKLVYSVLNSIEGSK